MKALIARKVGMTSAIAEDGVVEAITLLSVDPQVITQIKTEDTDGYTALQVGTGTDKKAGKAAKGHFKASKAMPKIVREFRIDELEENMSVGETYSADVFNIGDTVHVTGTSKGKGWAGTIKRHNFHRQRASHGSSAHERRPGSIGSMYPQHIFKGKKMAGQMGAEQVTVRNLKVALVDMDLGVIGISGAVPGPRKGIVIIREAA